MGRSSFLLACLAMGALAVPEIGWLIGRTWNSVDYDIWQVQGEARSITTIGWNGKYWLIGTSDGWLVRLDGSNFSVVGRVDIEGVHPYLIWTGKYWLGTSGVYYCAAFVYDGKKLVELRYSPFNEIVKVSYASNICLLLNQVPYTSNYSILIWDGAEIRVLVENALDLLPREKRTYCDGMPLRVELITNGSACLIYISCELPLNEKVSPPYKEHFCHALYLYDGSDLVNLSWTLPENISLWRTPPKSWPSFWRELSNGTHWVSLTSTGKLLLFNGKEFEEVKADSNLLQLDWGRIYWNGEYWLICTKGRLLRLEGSKLELAADLSNLGLGSFIPYSADWNGEYWLISYRKLISNIPTEACLVKYDGKGVELVQAPEDFSLIGFRGSRWPIDLGEVAWGDGRWLIAGRHRSSFTSRRWGYLLSYDGEKFEDLMQELNKAIELRGGGPGGPRSALWDVQFLATVLLFLALSVIYLLVRRYLSL